MPLSLSLQAVLRLVNFARIPAERKLILDKISQYVQSKIDQQQDVQLNFICTHNSRRSQFGQVWAAVAAHYYHVPVSTYSGGTEVDAANSRTLQSLERLGFEVKIGDGDNPKCDITYNSDQDPLVLFSKVYDDDYNPKSGFLAIMTCDHANEHCPVVTGSDQKIALTYRDPKYYDNSPLEPAMYDERSFQIATEMMYVFHGIEV